MERSTQTAFLHLRALRSTAAPTPPPPSKCETPPTPISSRERERVPFAHVITPVAFQHLWPGSPNRKPGFQDKVNIQTSDHTMPILIGFSQ
ncbi:hypothetical protein AVEN_124880-1 [Araneus ventricosus]|uniref:Uncharacterized protein n=1 Tax=Araneus ventricosus TaxID=182803 RepID=A0A4Y2TTW6_ARAVE|nr:hypothetical protein AVEN_124880-1 [Araneus ventricosus]